MTAWVINGSITGTTEIDQSTVALYSDLIVYAATPELVATQVANVKESLNAKSITYTKYSNLTAISSALTEDDEATAVAMADSVVTLTPAEYGNVVTVSSLISHQTSGHVDSGAAYLIGRNMGTSMDGLAIAALDAFGGTVLYPNAASSANTCGLGDVMDKTFAGRLYNKLSRTNVPGLMGGQYIAIAHDDVLHDLRQDTSTGGWIDVSKYANPQSVLQGEVGMYSGIRWLRSSNVTLTSSTIAYTSKVNVCGFNSLGYAVAQAPGIRIAPANDNLGRFVNVGWYGVFVYDTIDANNQIQGICASSINAA